MEDSNTSSQVRVFMKNGKARQNARTPLPVRFIGTDSLLIPQLEDIPRLRAQVNVLVQRVDTPRKYQQIP